MHYRDVISGIKLWGDTRVLVTGPHRSGTTIAAKILAKELSFQFVDETEIHGDRLEDVFSLYANMRKFVLQAPGLSFLCHRMPGAIVFMMRRTEDILKSEKRIGWGSSYELEKYFRTKGSAPEVKYEAWWMWQKTFPGPTKTLVTDDEWISPSPKEVANKFELDYESIKDHPLYLSPGQRINFEPKQTQ